MFTPEILLVDGDDELLDDAAADDKKLLEARMIAKRIKEPMGTQKVTDKATGESVCGGRYVILSRASPSGICRPFCCCVK